MGDIQPLHGPYREPAVLRDTVGDGMLGQVHLSCMCRREAGIVGGLGGPSLLQYALVYSSGEQGAYCKRAANSWPHEGTELTFILQPRDGAGTAFQPSVCDLGRQRVAWAQEHSEGNQVRFTMYPLVRELHGLEEIIINLPCHNFQRE